MNSKNYKEITQLYQEILKRYLNYHRYAKIIKFKPGLFYFSLLITSLFYLHLIIVDIENINSFFIEKLSLLFDNYKIESFKFIKLGFIDLSLKYLVIPGKYPTKDFILYNLIASGIILVILNFLKRIPLNIRVSLVFVIIPLVISCIYFYFFEQYFPYDINDFSILYLQLQTGILIFIPILLSIILSIFNFSIFLVFSNLIVILITVVYSIIFGYLRYGVFLYILSNYSYLYMANLFFTFGPFLDFLYISAIYSIYISIIAKYYKDIKYYKFVQ
jgi:hypothetical protein